MFSDPIFRHATLLTVLYAVCRWAVNPLTSPGPGMKNAPGHINFISATFWSENVDTLAPRPFTCHPGLGWAGLGWAGLRNVATN